LDCKIQWLQHDHPSLNFKKFTKDEIAKLVELVDGERGLKNWEEIAKELGVSFLSLSLFRGGIKLMIGVDVSRMEESVGIV